jgi:hypothetical protein
MNEQLKQKYDKIISIGSNCYIKIFLDYIKQQQETHFFDNIGSPMWSVYELLKNDFEDVFNFDDYSPELIMKGGSRIFTNTKYDLKFKHDLRETEMKNGKGGMGFLNFKEKYERRIKRFRDLLSSSNRILFIRFEEIRENRIVKICYNEKNRISELEYIKLFSEFLKTNFNDLKFNIVFISKNSKSNVDETYNIITIQENKKDKIKDYKMVGGQIENLLIQNLHLL